MVSGVVREWNHDIRISCFDSGEAILAAYDSFDVIFLDIDHKAFVRHGKSHSAGALIDTADLSRHLVNTLDRHHADPSWILPA